MLKPRNVLIIIIMVLIVLAIMNMLLEFIVLSSASQSMDTYVKIAANSALRSATVADEFFTSGTTADDTYVGGITKLNAFRTDEGAAPLNVAAMSTSGLMVDLFGNNEFVQSTTDSMDVDTNVFSLAYPEIETAGNDYLARAELAFKKLFANNEGGTTSFGNWCRNIWNADVNHTNGYLAPRALYWTDVTDDTVNNGVVRVPRLLSMGAALVTDGDFSSLYAGDDWNSSISPVTEGIGIVSLDDVLSAMAASNESDTGGYYGEGNAAANIKIALGNASPDDEPDFSSVSEEEGCLALLKSLDYISYKRVTTMADDETWNIGEYADDTMFKKDSEVVYYYTPLSIGLTYIDPIVLDVLFRSNLDLLMRAKYIATNGYDLSQKISSDQDNTGIAYDPFMHKTYYDTANPDYAGNDATQYGNTGKPTGFPGGDDAWRSCVVNNGQVYYMRGLLDRTDDKAIYRDIWGQEMTNTPVIEYIYIPITSDNCAELDDNPALREMLGRAIDPACTFSSLLDSSAEAESYNADGDKMYDLVIAKCTFYADFCYPYQTATLRGMAIHFNDPGEDTSMSRLRAQGISRPVQDAYKEQGTSIYEADSAALNNIMDMLTQLSRFSEDGDYEYMQYAYTTYFAVAN